MIWSSGFLTANWCKFSRSKTWVEGLLTTEKTEKTEEESWGLVRDLRNIFPCLYSDTKRMRLFSSILFAIMAVVLPVAGVQKQFCTMAMAFVDGSDVCPARKNDCCGKKDSHKPEDCMITAKLLPNAEKSSPASLPAMPSAWTWLSIPVFDTITELSVRKISPEPPRGPPDPPRLFLIHRNLLI